MELKTENLLLRTVLQDDLQEVARMWNFGKGEIPLAEAQKAIDWMKENHCQNKLNKIVHICLAVFKNDDYKKIIGWCGLDGRNSEKGINIFYLLDEKYRGKGYGTECAQKILEFGFSQLKITRINGCCSKENIASNRILEKIGMQKIIKDTAQAENDNYFFLTFRAYKSLRNL